MGVARRPKGKVKKALGPRKALEALAQKLGAHVVKRQRERGIPAPSAPAVEFDDVAGWADVPKQMMPSGGVQRRFIWTRQS